MRNRSVFLPFRFAVQSEYQISPFAGPGKIFSECNAPLCAVRTIPSARRQSKKIDSFWIFANVLLFEPSGDGDSRFMNAGLRA